LNDLLWSFGSEDLPELELKQGDVVRLEGMLSLQVKDGKVLICGGLHEKGSKLVVPRAKSLPLEAETEAIVEYTLGESGNVERLAERTISREWDELIAAIIREKPRLIMVIGDVDVGKTFFTTYVANNLLKNGVRTAVLDGDVGQSDIGPPSTMGIGIFERPVGLLSEVPTRTAYFVGSMSPSNHLLEFTVGMKKLMELGIKEADVVIVNTPGWISGGSGRALQLYMMELLNPDLLVALQRGRELEHLLLAVPQAKLRRIPVYQKVRSRSPSERTLLRWLALARYFEDSSRVVLDLRKVRLDRCYYRTGEPIDPRSLNIQTPVVYAEKLPEGRFIATEIPLDEKVIWELEEKFGRIKAVSTGSEKNVLVGLVDHENMFVGIGIIDEIDYTRDRIAVITPVKNIEKIAAVQFGSMKLKPTGEEIGTVKPGTF
jgi:polynucleotide 5'-hydroxyl-kinase GRC3/NOL9